MEKTDSANTFDPGLFIDDILGIIDDTRARQDYQQLLNIYDSLAMALMVKPDEVNDVLDSIESSIAEIDHALSEVDAAWRINSTIIEGYYPSIELVVSHDDQVVFKTQMDHSTARIMMAKRKRERRR